MSSTIKLWELKNLRDGRTIGLLESWDMGQILAKRLSLDNFSLEAVEVTARKLEMSEVHNFPATGGSLDGVTP